MVTKKNILAIIKDNYHPVMNLLERNIEQIKRLCQLNSVYQLFVFGSVTNQNFHDRSDIDFVVDINDPDPIHYTDKSFNHS